MGGRGGGERERERCKEGGKGIHKEIKRQGSKKKKRERENETKTDKSNAELVAVHASTHFMAQPLTALRQGYPDSSGFHHCHRIAGAFDAPVKSVTQTNCYAHKPLSLPTYFAFPALSIARYSHTHSA